MTKEQQVSADNDQWGYGDHPLAPEQWPKYYSTGRHQSPINILVKECELCLAGSTCCQCQTTGAVAALRADKHLLAAAKRRSHLDSAGEDLRANSSPPQRHHQRSHHHHHMSTTKGDSSNSSSPSQHFNRYSDDGDDEAYDDRYDKYDDYANNNNNNNNNNKCRPPSATKQQLSSLRQNTRHCVSHKKIFLGYPRYLSTMQLCNTGHGWQVNLPAELSAHTLLAGPPLADREYRLAQFHCHWGEDCDHGSEHQINGKSFAAEIHFVHWNCTQFRSFEEASRHKHGLAVLAVLVQALDGEQNLNKHLEKIIAGLRKVHRANSSTAIQPRLDLKKLFPANRWTYASYEGSLTTPPLSEVVDWVVFLNPIQCSSSQIEEFRQLQCSGSSSNAGGTGSATGASNRLRQNCRPIQPSNERLVSIWTHH